jgi:hypothetical protein
MVKPLRTLLTLLALCSLCLTVSIAAAQDQIDKAAPPKKFSAIAFYTGKADQAHISFIGECKKWFPEIAAKNNFDCEMTNDWDQMTPENLAKHQVVIFWDTRPEKPEHRKAFQDYIENGGGWMGFHFAGFALTPSAYPQNWDWYHDNFLGADQFVSNTWRPTSAILKVEVKDHPATAGLPDTFKTRPSEWYRWRGELRKNPDIKVLLSVDPSSFPLGTGPKQHEIWHSGDYPIVWTNTRYRMIYFNFGHNDIDYENKTNKELSQTFGDENQDRLVVNSLLWLGEKTDKPDSSQK